MSQYDSLYEQAGQQYGVDPKLLKAVAETESGENPEAVSPQGARGITQFMPATAKAMGIDPNDPDQAIPATAKLLAQNFATYGDADKAIMAYHGGTDPANWGPRTNAYLQKVSQAYGNMSDLQPQPNNSVPQSFDVAGGIAKARKAGYSDQEIESYLSQDPQFHAALTKAKAAGYSDQDIYQHFGLNTAPQKQTASPSGPQSVDAQSLSAADAKHPYSGTDSLVNSMTFGLGKEASALGMATGKFLHGQGFDFPGAEHIVDAQAAEYDKQHPDLNTAANVFGTIFGAAPIAKGAVAAKTLGGLVKQGAQAGAAVGALSGAAQSRGDLTNRLGGGVEGATIGALTGGATPLAFRGLGRLGSGIGAVGRSVVAPFTQQGQQDIARNIIERYAGGPVTANPTQIVPGSVPTLAEASANPGIAALQRTMRDINPNSPFISREQVQAASRNNLFDKIAGTHQDIESAVDARNSAALPILDQAFENAGEADPKYVRRTINTILASPAGQRDAVASSLMKIRDKLEMDYPLSDRVSDAMGPIKDALSNQNLSDAKRADLLEARRLLNSANRGFTSEDDLISGLGKLAKNQKIVGPIDNALSVAKSGGTRLETDPAQLYGIRQSITDMLSPLARGSDSDARLAAKQLKAVTDSLDNAIETAAPGYKNYLETYANMSKPINAMETLQGLRITDAKGNITLAKVQNAIDKITKERNAGGARGAKSLSADQLEALSSIRDDLLRGQNIMLGRSLGSNTAQNLASQHLLGNLFPGKLGAFANHINPTALGSGLGAAIGSIGGPVGAGAGAAIGGGGMRIANDAIKRQLEEMLLNPALYQRSAQRVAQKAVQGAAARNTAKLSPAAAAAVNRLFFSALPSNP